MSSSSSATAPETFVAGLQSQLKVSFANNALEIYAPRATLVRVQVFDMLGHAIHSFSDRLNGSRNVDLGQLSQGTYLVRVVGGNAVKTAKITIQ